jgi:4-amino-4-deoxy-L-arabinose transferase-like glycosyltransferase
LILILLAAFGARFGASYNLQDAVIDEADDTDAYYRLAKNLAETHTYVNDTGEFTAFRPVLYPLFLAGPATIAPDNAWAVYGLNAFLGALSAWFLYMVVRNLINPSAGLLAALFMAVEPYQVFMSTQVMSEVLFIPLLVLLLCFLLTEKRKVLKAPLAGIVFGLLVLTRPEGIVMIIPAVVAYLLLCKNWKAKAPAILLFLIFFSGVYGLWIYRNHERFDAVVPFTTHGGYTLALGNNENFYEVARREEVWGAEDFDAWTQQNNTETEGMNELERDAHYYAKAMEFIRADYARFSLLMWLKCKRFWRLYPHNVSLARREASTLYMILLYLFSLAGVVSLLRRRRPLLVLLLTIALLCLVHMVYWSQIRFRVPLHPIFILFTMCVIYMRSLKKVEAPESEEQKPEESKEEEGTAGVP